MEFFIDEAGKVSFCGYSHFVTDWKGAYQGNLLEPDEEVERWILQYVPQETLVAVRRNLQSMLEKLYGGKYTGHLGVDMMVCPDQGGYPYAIHPHVEVNLRMTMGMVAWVFYNRFVACGSKGISGSMVSALTKPCRSCTRRTRRRGLWCWKPER